MFKCIIIEDEPLAASLLEKYVGMYPNLEHLQSFRHALDAKTFLEENQVDIIFLDLHLPGMKGFEFLELLEEQYHVVITTAYSDHALEGFEKGVIDYLLKPILYPRFQLAMDRLNNLLDTNSENASNLTIQINKSKVKISENDITYIESNKGYVNIFDKNGRMYRTKMGTQAIYEKLSANFLRIHKSYIINRNYVTSFSSSIIDLNHSINVPIGRKFKDEIIPELSKAF